MLNTMIQVLTLWAQIAGSNGNCMVDSAEAGTAVLLCGFVDGAYGWDDSAGVSQGEYPASWLGPEGATTGQLNVAVNGAVLSVVTPDPLGMDAANEAAAKCPNLPYLFVQRVNGHNHYTAVCPRVETRAMETWYRNLDADRAKGQYPLTGSEAVRANMLRAELAKGDDGGDISLDCTTY